MRSMPQDKDLVLERKCPPGGCGMAGGDDQIRKNDQKEARSLPMICVSLVVDTLKALRSLYFIPDSELLLFLENCPGARRNVESVSKSDPEKGEGKRDIADKSDDSNN